MLFPVIDAPNLICRYKTHQLFIKKSKTLSEAAKPAKFTNDTKWLDWIPTLLNYLRHIPGRDGVPLKYICRANDAPDPTPNPDFIDDYVSMAPLRGEAFVIDAAEVHTLIVNFITGNETAEVKIKEHEDENNGRLDYIALRDHYEGVGILANEITAAEYTIKTVHYVGEKRPYMWWDEFEKKPTSTFNIVHKKEGRAVYSNNMKLRLLLEKVTADFLGHAKAGISIELMLIPMVMTYERALAIFRNEVNRKFPPQMLQNNKAKRTINEVVRGDKAFVGGRHGGRGKFARGGRNRGGRRTRTDSTMITLTDGQKVEYHPSFTFPPHIYRKMNKADQEKLRKERQELKNKNNNNNNANLQRQIQELQKQINAQSSQNATSNEGSIMVPTNVSLGNVSQVSTGHLQGSMFGGRNEQANHNQRNK